jgi:hypothetical protein
MSRSLLAALLIGTLSIVPFAPAARGAADGKCTIATKGDSPVAKACKTGGIKQATTTMKAMKKAGAAKGVKYDCDDCHKDVAAANYALTGDAQEKFKKLLAAQK